MCIHLCIYSYMISFYSVIHIHSIIHSDPLLVPLIICYSVIPFIHPSRTISLTVNSLIIYPSFHPSIHPSSTTLLTVNSLIIWLIFPSTHPISNTYWLICPFCPSFLCTLIHSITQPPPRSIHSLVHYFNCLFVHSFTPQIFTYSLGYIVLNTGTYFYLSTHPTVHTSFICLFGCSFIHSFYSSIHPSILSFIH